MLNCLHIVPDDKFIDAAINIFDEISVRNRYLCVVPSLSYQFVYIHQQQKIELTTVDMLDTIWNDTTIDIFIFHTLDYNRYADVLKIPSNKKIIWIAWGYDIYIPQGLAPAVCPMELYQPLTKIYLQSLSPKRNSWKKIKYMAKWLLRFWQLWNACFQQRLRKQADISLQQQVLQRIDYVSTVLPSEYDMLKKNPCFSASYMPFQYVSQQQQAVDFDDDANYILLGNSADPANNHLDIIQLITKKRITNSIYTPLAYGDKEYVECIEQTVANNEQYILQTQFYGRDEYLAQLRKCRVGVFPHLRQQALGNICAMLRQGSKVFLYKSSVAYAYFKYSGYIVFSIEDELTQSNINEPLAKELKTLNRNKLNEWLDYENVVNRLTDFFYMHFY